jgi:hypothetical protein
VFRTDKDVAAGAAAPTDTTNDGWTAL